MTKTSKFMTTIKKMLTSKRAGILSIALSVSLLAYQSCTNERPVIDELREDKYLTESTKDLKQAYSLEYKELSMRSEAMSDSIFGFQGLEPQWHLSQTTIIGDSIEITEVPLVAEWACLPVSETLLSSDIEKYPDKARYVYLIRRKLLKKDSISMNYFMNVMPDTTMLRSGQSLSHRPGLLPSLFSGEVLFFDLKGHLKRKHIYSEGVLRETYKPTISSSILRFSFYTKCFTIITETDYYYYGEARGERTEEKYSHTSYRTETRCINITNMEREVSPRVEDYDHSGGGGSPTNTNIDAPSPEVKMSDEFKASKLECIYNKMINSSDFIRMIHNRFAPQTAKFNLHLRISPEPIDGDKHAQTKREGLKDVYIFFDTSKMAKLPNIQYALIIAHEMIHAMIFLDALENIRDIKEQEEIKKFYQERNIPKIYDYLRKNGKCSQHEYMSFRVVKELSSILENFYKANPIEGKVLTKEDFDALAWQGLHKTNGWKNKSAQDRYKLEMALYNLKKDSTFYVPQQCKRLEK